MSFAKLDAFIKAQNLRIKQWQRAIDPRTPPLERGASVPAYRPMASRCSDCDAIFGVGPARHAANCPQATTDEPA